jgi:hypothetical protein
MSLTKERLIGSAVLIVIGFLVTAFVIVSARAKMSNTHAYQTTSAGSQGLPTRLPTGPVQVVRFTLYDVGIVPQTAYAQPGLVTIAMEDLSGGTTGLIVERDDEGQARLQVGEVRRKENKRRGQEELRLTPGRYQLYMADRPENRAELIVEP